MRQSERCQTNFQQQYNEYSKIKQCPETGSIPEYYHLISSLLLKPLQLCTKRELVILINMIVANKGRHNTSSCSGIAKDNSRIVHQNSSWSYGIGCISVFGRLRVFIFLHGLLNTFLISLYETFKCIFICRSSCHVNSLQCWSQCLHSTSCSHSQEKKSKGFITQFRNDFDTTERTYLLIEETTRNIQRYN